MPKVYNKYHKNAPDDAIYIGRGSPWGNQFVIGGANTRESVLLAYETWLLSSPPEFIERVKKELKGKDLVCFCAPRACHGDILLRMANEDE